ncbi:MAG: S8 family serine peptidase, partial [Candidatus Aenigmatarchaeota archaeon]
MRLLIAIIIIASLISVSYVNAQTKEECEIGNGTWIVPKVIDPNEPNLPQPYCRCNSGFYWNGTYCKAVEKQILCENTGGYWNSTDCICPNNSIGFKEGFGCDYFANPLLSNEKVVQNSDYLILIMAIVIVIIIILLFLIKRYFNKNHIHVFVLALITAVLLLSTTVFAISTNIDKQIYTKQINNNPQPYLEKIDKDIIEDFEFKSSASSLSKDKYIFVSVIMNNQPLLKLNNTLKQDFIKNLNGEKRKLEPLLNKYRPYTNLGDKSNNKINELSLISDNNNYSEIKEHGTVIEQIKQSYKNELYKNLDQSIKESILNTSQTINKFNADILEINPLLNVVKIKIPKDKIVDLAKDDNVNRILSEKPKDVKLLDVSVPTISASTWWSAGYDGGWVDVAVVDTGVDKNHPDLLDDKDGTIRIFYERDFTTENTPDDLDGHGTHVAGIISSSHATYRGVAPGVDALINAKMIGNGSTQSIAINAMDWAVTNLSIDDAEILSNSWGWCDEWDGQPQDGENTLARYVDSLADNWIVTIVFAAGNEGPSGTQCTPSNTSSLRHPADAYNIITVGAMDDKNTLSKSDDSIAAYSSRGPTDDGRKKPDIVAPGSLIYSAAYDWEGGFLGLNPDFVDKSGTSMAAPHVSGAAALLTQFLLTPQEVKALLINTATDKGSIGWDKEYGWGYVDLPRAFTFKTETFINNITENRFVFYKVPIVLSGERATLVWDRHIRYNGTTPTVFYPVNDLDLYFYKESDNSIISSSISGRDNVEQVKSDATYSDVVLKIDAYTQDFYHDSNTEDFSIATEGLYSLVTGPNVTPNQNLSSNVTDGNVLSISLNVSNIGDINAHNVKVLLNISNDFLFINGTNTSNLGTVNYSSSKILNWNFSPNKLGNYIIQSFYNHSSYGEFFNGSSSASFVSVTDDDSDAPIFSNWNFTTNTTADKSIAVSVNISDFSGINRSVLFYNYGNDSSIDGQLNMTLSGVWSANIPSAGAAFEGKLISFYIETTDNDTDRENDSISINSTLQYVFLLNEPPTITFISPSDSNNSFVNRNHTFISVNIVDVNTINSCILEWNSTNQSMTKLGSGNSVSCFLNKTDSDGTYTYKIYANDSLGNSGSVFRIIKFDSTPPNIILTYPFNGTYVRGLNNETFYVTYNELNLNNIQLFFDQKNQINETASISTSNTKIYLQDNLGKSGLRTTLTKDNMLTLLAEGSFADSDGTHKFYQFIDVTPVGTAANYRVDFDKPGSSSNVDPAYNFGRFTTSPTASEYMYRARIVFDVAVNGTNSVGKKITLFGKQYTITNETSNILTGSTSDKIVLYNDADAEKITFQNSAKVKKGSNDDTVDGTFVSLSASSRKLSQVIIYFAGTSSTNDYITAGGATYLNPVFKTFGLNFASMSPAIGGANDDNMKFVNSGDNDLQATMTDFNGNKATINYGHKTASSAATLLSQDSSGNAIHLSE